MREELEKYELIDQYLAGELSGDQLASFEKRIKSDPKFAEAVQLQKIANEIIIDHQLLKVKDKLKVIHETHHAGGSNGKWYWILGSAIVLSALITWWFVKNEQMSPAPHNSVTDVAERPIEKRTTTLSADSITRIDSAIFINPPSSSYDSTTAAKTEESGGDLSPPRINRIDSSALSEVNEKNLPATELSTYTACEIVIPKEAISVFPSCADQQNGEIIIHKNLIQNAKEPITITFGNSKISTSDSVFSGLMGRSYMLTITDFQGCLKAIEIVVGNKICETETPYVFNPLQGEKWVFPMAKSSSGEITIRNQNGRVVYKTRVTQGYPESWDGNSNEGQPLLMGVYLFVYKDDNGKGMSGQVTLLR